jgi:hypothetical protein
MAVSGRLQSYGNVFWQCLRISTNPLWGGELQVCGRRWPKKVMSLPLTEEAEANRAKRGGERHLETLPTNPILK